MDIKNNPSKSENSQRRSSYYNDELPYFYSQDSDVIFQIDSSKNRHGADNSFSEGEVFDFDMISAAENLDFLFDDENHDSELEFARNPFGGMESRESFFQDDEEFNEDIKSVGADKISSFINRKAFQNTEKLEFSDPTLETGKKSDLSVVENFMPVRPEMFLFNFDASDFNREHRNLSSASQESPWAEPEYSHETRTEASEETESSSESAGEKGHEDEEKISQKSQKNDFSDKKKILK